MTGTAISVHNLSKIYKLYDDPVDRLKESLNPFRKKYHRDFYALKDVSFDIKKGETVGIVGKNGSGKSTLLKILTGVLTPSSGTVAVNGKVSALLELGAGFNPELTGLENVYFSGTIMGYTKEEMDAKRDDILSFADIGDFVYQPVKIYSSGMYVRLAFAVATAIDPEILIVDEALSVGDAKFQSKSFARMESFKKNGKSIIVVSHDLNTIKYLCRRALYIDNGVITADGESKYVTDLYHKNLFNGPSAEKDVVSVFSEEIQQNPETSSADIKQKEINCLSHELAETSQQMLSIERQRIKKNVLDKLGLKDMGCSDCGDKRAEFIDFGILDKNGTKSNLLNTGEKYILFSKLMFYDEPEALSLGVRIRTKKGMDIFVINSVRQKVELPSFEKGNILESTISISMCLAPGDYFLGFGAANYPAPNVTIYDSWLDAVHFTVVGDCSLDQDSVVNLFPKWSAKVIPPICELSANADVHKKSR